MNTSCNGPDPVLTWWNGLTPAQKGLVVLGVVITVAIVSCAIGCEGFAAVPEAAAGAGLNLGLGGVFTGAISVGDILGTGLGIGVGTFGGLSLALKIYDSINSATPRTTTTPGGDYTGSGAIGGIGTMGIDTGYVAGALTNFNWQPAPLRDLGVRGKRALACFGIASAVTAGTILWSLPTAAEQRNHPGAWRGNGVDFSPWVFLGTFIGCSGIANHIGSNTAT